MIAAAAAPRVAAAESSPCDALLAGLVEAATASGFALTSTADELVGIDGTQNELRAWCDDAGATIHLAAPDGAGVDIELSAGDSRVVGSFPGVGRVSQRWVADVADEGRVRFSAETDAVAAWAEFDAASGVWAEDGDAGGMNVWFQPVLAGSAVWRHAHVLLFALTDVWTAGLDADASGLDAMLDVAIPTVAVDDVDKGGVKKECGSAIGICAVAIFWKGATFACVGQGLKCFSAFKCWKSDCSGDGKA